MAVSQAQICNLALSHIHQTTTTIANLGTDTGNVAVQCRIHYDTARRFVLSDHYWNFATKRQTLASIGTPPALWAYRYDYPSDCVSSGFREIQRLSKDDAPVPYVVELEDNGFGLSVLTDMPNAVGIYTSDVENTVLFSPGFVQTFSRYLAASLAEALTGNLNVQQSQLSIYQGLKRSAMVADSNEGEFQHSYDSPWERARQ